ncbi:MAG: acyltransferase 3, partial [Solirubrobacterales bacterium]|nr:acyltransferase 3 [Solirubrobacterales bacterium]
MTRGERRFVAGDPLRALAALAVLAMHCSLLVASRHNGIANAEIAFGQTKGRAILALQLGVYVFFVLSGYLLARPFIRAFTHGTAPPTPGRYLERRLLRIVPAFWVVCLVMIAIYGTGGSPAGEVIAMFGFAQTYNPGLVDGWMGQAWTLDCEMLFYLLLPIGAFLLVRSLGRLPRDRRRLALVTVLLVAIGYVGYQLRGLGVASAQEGAAPLGLLRAFLPGIGLAAFEVLAVDRLRGKRWGPWVALACVALGLAALATTLGMNQS